MSEIRSLMPGIASPYLYNGTLLLNLSTVVNLISMPQPKYGFLYAPFT